VRQAKGFALKIPEVPLYPLEVTLERGIDDAEVRDPRWGLYDKLINYIAERLSLLSRDLSILIPDSHDCSAFSIDLADMEKRDPRNPAFYCDETNTATVCQAYVTMLE
jgi:hypothetical protein